MKIKLKGLGGTPAASTPSGTPLPAMPPPPQAPPSAASMMTPPAALPMAYGAPGSTVPNMPSAAGSTAAGTKRTASAAQIGASGAAGSGSGEPVAKRQHSESQLSAGSTAPSGNKFKFTFKGHAASSATNTPASTPQMVAPRPQTLTPTPPIGNSSLMAMLGPAPPAPPAQQAPATNAPQGNRFAIRVAPRQAPLATPPQAPPAAPQLSRAQQKAQEKAARDQAKAEKKAQEQRERELQEQERRENDQLQAVMRQAFGVGRQPAPSNKPIKFKVKGSTSTLSGMALPRPAAPPPAPPEPGMVPLPSANGNAAPTPKFKIKLGGRPAPPAYAAPFTAPGAAPAAFPGAAQSAAFPGSPARPVPMGRGPPVGARGRGRGRGPGFGVARPAVPRRPKADDDDYNPAADMAFIPAQPQRTYPRPMAHLQPRGPRPALGSQPVTQQLCMFKVLEGLGRHDDEQKGIFKAPVTDELAPGYSKAISNPMCFDTMRDKLNTGQYPTWEAFEFDLNLVFDNAILFNGQAHFVSHWARFLRAVSEKFIPMAKQGIINFRGVAAPIKKKYMSEWHRLNPNSVVFVESRPMKPAFQQRAMSTASAETGGLPVPGRPVVMKQVAVVPRQRPSSVAAGGGRAHRSGLHVFPEAGRGMRKNAARQMQIQRSARSYDLTLNKMAQVYVRRNENEDLRETYHVKVPDTVPVAKWRGLAGGANAEGQDFAAGHFALRPMWPAGLYKSIQDAFKAIQEKGAQSGSFQGEALPRDAYTRSVARFVRRCHPALRKIVSTTRITPCVHVEGLPEPPVDIATAASLIDKYKKEGVTLNMAAAGAARSSQHPGRSPSPQKEDAAEILLMMHGGGGAGGGAQGQQSGAQGQQGAQLVARQQPAGQAAVPPSAPVLNLGAPPRQGGAAAPARGLQPVDVPHREPTPMETDSGSPLPELPPASPST